MKQTKRNIQYDFLLTLSLFMIGCTTPQPKQHTYLMYSGFVEGCTYGMTAAALDLIPDITHQNQVNSEWTNARCMELYMRKLEMENIKPKGIDTYLDRNEAI